MEFAVKSVKTGIVHAVFSRENPAKQFAESAFFAGNGAEVIKIRNIEEVYSVPYERPVSCK